MGVTGEETPTSGTAFVFGKDIVASPKAIRQHVMLKVLLSSYSDRMDMEC